MFEKILSLYGLSPNAAITPFGSGLINNTWKISDEKEDYILQRINDEVFKKPWNISDNIESIGEFLKKEHPGYLFVTPIKTVDDKSMIYLDEKGYYRLFPFIKNSVTLTVAKTPTDAFEAAKQFGLFTKNLSSFPVNSLKTTLPNFHNVEFRYSQFEEALQQGNANRILETKSVADFLIQHNHIVSTYKKITTSKEWKQRVTHHDTKISNVLFDKNGKGLCVIDLDTVMPGFFISDVGDMMRTYLSPVSEEEKDFSKIEIREDFFRGIVEGYMHEMAAELTTEEIDHFVYAGLFLTYMQALRFLTDYLNNDRYYGSAYEGQNLVRAKNQVVLLEQLIDKEIVLKQIVTETVKS